MRLVASTGWECTEPAAAARERIGRPPATTHGGQRFPHVGRVVVDGVGGTPNRPLAEPGSASEDYSEFVKAGVPSFYFSLSSTDPRDIAAAAAKGVSVPGNHSPLFAPVPEPTIRTGVEAMSLVLLNVVGK